jgi:cellulose synthase/poly-beta-1,6-N-acetylglucosamine synthase-like glycosyltransferase
MTSVFWIALLLIMYTYMGYPLVMVLMQKIRRNNIRKSAITPSVSVVIVAYNEEKNIVARLENMLQQNYPKERLEIIVSSDGSTDRTVEFASTFTNQQVFVTELNSNQGKAVALNQAVSMATGEIIVFTDARQEFHVDAVKNLVANLADETIGCVSGELNFLKDSESKIEAEMGAYWKYEKCIRRSESATGSVVGATGCIYAIRRELYQPLPAGTILDDVLTPMNIARQGKRVLFESQAIAYDIISKNASQEWRRKVRTLAGNWQLLSLAPWIILPWKNTLWIRYVSHKLLRLLVPFGLVAFAVSSALLEGGFYRIVTLMQLVFYGMALSGFLLPSTRSSRLINLSYFFVVMNAAAVAGFWKWLTGGCATAWQPAYSGKETVRG